MFGLYPVAMTVTADCSSVLSSRAPSVFQDQIFELFAVETLVSVRLGPFANADLKLPQRQFWFLAFI